MSTHKSRLGVYKFTSCDGCQLAFLNLGSNLLKLAEAVDIVHFAELGPINPDAQVDFAYVEGSVSTPEEIDRIKKIRKNSRYLITIGACATAGGIQALRNFADGGKWIKSIYAKPETISALETSTAISDHVNVDLELWGCPVNSQQILDSINALLLKSMPDIRRDSVCIECKRSGYICVMVTQGIPCMGPVTQTGCGALCPGVNRDCYACYGPSENPNTDSFSHWLKTLGLSDEEIKRRFLFINNQAKSFKKAALKIKKG